MFFTRAVSVRRQDALCSTSMKYLYTTGEGLKLREWIVSELWNSCFYDKTEQTYGVWWRRICFVFGERFQTFELRGIVIYFTSVHMREKFWILQERINNLVWKKRVFFHYVLTCLCIYLCLKLHLLWMLQNMKMDKKSLTGNNRVANCKVTVLLYRIVSLLRPLIKFRLQSELEKIDEFPFKFNLL